MREANYIDSNDVLEQEYSEKKIENGDPGLSKSIQFVVNEVSSLLNYNVSKTKEQDVSCSLGENGFLEVDTTEVRKTIQVSSAFKLKSNNPLLLSLTALLSNPHHTKYLNVMTENIIEGFSESQFKKFNLDELGNKSNDPISKDSKNSIINLIASNLQYYLFEGRATNIVINDLVVALMKAYSSEKTSNKVFDINNWETNNQVFIEARDWCVLIGPKECIFPKTCYELRELLNKQGIKLKSYFENVNSENAIFFKINPTAGEADLQDTNNYSIDDLDTQYFEKLSYSKLKEYKSNNIPNYSHFKQIKKFISVQYPNLKSFFHSPGSCIYINGNDVITFLDILKKSTEEIKIKQESENRNNLINKKIPNSKNPYWFLKDTKRIISNFPIKDTIFKASTCDCNFIHNSGQNKVQGFYELNVQGLFLPNSLYVILNGFKLLFPDIHTCEVAIENTAEPPFFPSEANNPVFIWEKLIPLLNTTIRSINPTLVELANQLKPYTKVCFKSSKANTENIKNNQEQTQIQAFNYTLPFFSLPRKRLNPSSQIQNPQRSYSNINCRNSSQNFVNNSTSVINNSAVSQIQPRNTYTTNSTFSNILFDLSASNGVYESINAQVGSVLTHGISNFPHITGTSSSAENQALLTISQNNTQNYPPLLPSSGIRARVPNSVTTNIQWLNFRGVGFSTQANSNYVSLSTPMGKQLLHRIGTLNPSQRLEQVQNITNLQIKPTNTKKLNSNKNLPLSENLTTKIFEETALCFVGFDSERLDYFTTRAIEEGAKVVKLSHLENEYMKQNSKCTASKELNSSNFVYPWLNVTRFYCVLDFSMTITDCTNKLNLYFEKIHQYFGVQQLVSLEWFLTSCFERRSLDPDMFTPICRPDFSIQTANKFYPVHSAEDNILVIVIENFPHMNKIYNSSKEGQEFLSNAIWSNCIQRILKSIYGSNVTNMKEILNLIEKNKFKWETDFPKSVIVVPCNLIPYKSSLNVADSESLDTPISALYGPNKCQFINNLDTIKNYLLSHFNFTKDKNFEEILHIVAPSWILDSCSKRLKINYKEYGIRYSTSVVQIQKSRKRTKTTIIGDNNSLHKEVCFFYKKYNSKIHNLIPPVGPWPLWGWNIFVIDSIERCLSENIRKKLKEVGANVINSTETFENITSYSQEQLKALLDKIELNGVKLIICSDFLDTQLIKKIENINGQTKNEANYQASKKINVVGESWINMVHGTRTLHPFECKFYLDLKLDYNKKFQDKEINPSKDPENYSLKKIDQVANCNGSTNNPDKFMTTKSKFTACDNAGNSILENPKYENEIYVENVARGNEIARIDSGEHESTEFIENNKFQVSNLPGSNKSNKQKRRRIVNKDFNTMGNTIDFESMNKKNLVCDPSFEKDHLNALDKVNQAENEFLVPLSLSFMSNWAEGKNKDFVPLFFSSQTPIRKGHEVKEVHLNTPTGSRSNFLDLFNTVEGFVECNICPNISNDEITSQTDKTTTFQKTLDESENDHLGITTSENYSPILCPIIPVNLNY